MSRFSIIPAIAILDARLSLRDLSVLAALGMHTDRHGWCHPSSERIGDLVGVSGAMVRRSIGTLTECGYLQVRARRREDGGQTSNLIRVLFDVEQPPEVLRAPAPPVTPEVAAPVTSGVTPPATPGVTPPVTPGVARMLPLNVPNERRKATRDFARPELPGWVPAEAWNSWWLVTRKKARAPNTDDALRLNLRTLAKLRDKGHDPLAVIEQSIERGWRGLFPIQPEKGNAATHPTRGRPSLAERVRANEQRIHAREAAAAGDAHGDALAEDGGHLHQCLDGEARRVPR